MNEQSFLRPSEIKELSNNFFENLGTVIDHCTVRDLETRLVALEKLADDFSPSEFVARYYPIEEIFDVYRHATESNICDEVVEAIAAVTEIDCSFARDICVDNLQHQDIDVREEAISCLGYVGVASDSKLLTDLMESESNDTLKAAAFNSLLRLGHDELLTMDKIDISQLSIEACISVLENLCTLTERFDLAKTYQFVSKSLISLNNEAINNELADLKYRIEKQETINEIAEMFSGDNIDWGVIIQLMENLDSDIRFRVLTRIGSGSKPNKKAMPNRPPQQVFDKVVALADDEDEEVRAEAISVLGDWEYNKSIDLISKCLHDDSELVRLDAIYALGEIQGDEVITQLSQLDIEKCSEIEKTRLYQALIRCGRKEFLEKWLKYLKSKDALVRANVAGGVWSVWNPNSHTIIESELEIAKNKETHTFVLAEIDDALDWINSQRHLN
ncbi:HEAT repeat domain-containing protein [Pseudoalteromonas obscura]|uniref:HEAT repeat domain-containing protein n=1 Tax=Pseudoalteromonas obscura TaxID=3048491 RepID=A0ABT7EP47_9GAMM|nr:HEAT repeat domain-containing protein [Pseudoalteromonas sp. P94(2023)]MDK2596817.1 HEAT repeat domain-containing protein [Pseudoalteromonas sp. P94(2023)]